MRDYQIGDCLTKHASRKSGRSPAENSARGHSGELRQKRTWWTDAKGNERSVTVLLATKNRGLRANRQMVR